MSKQSDKRVVSIKASTLATFQGTFAGIIGLGVAILHSMNRTVELASETNSVLAGLAFGLATGVVSILVLPLIYFGLGWIVGYVNGWVFNVVAKNSGGIVVTLEDE